MKQTSKHGLIARGVLLLLLLLLGITAVLQRKSFYEEREYYAINFFEDTYDLLAKDISSADQTFTAKQEELNSVYIKFNITNLVDLNGNLTVSILDSDDEIVSTRWKQLDTLIQTESSQWTEFPMNITLKKGEVYTLHVQVQKAADGNQDSSLELCLASNRQGLFHDLLLDGTPSTKRMVATFKYNTYCMDDLRTMLILLCISGLVVLLKGNTTFLPEYRAKFPAGRILLILTPFLADFMVQRFCGYSLGDFLEHLFTLKGCLNLSIYIAITLIFYLICGRAKWASALTMIFAYIPGLANYYVWSFRDCPIVAADLASIQTAANVASGYDYSLKFNGTWGTVILLTSLTLILMADSYKGMNLKKRLCTGLAGILMAAGLWTLIDDTDFMDKNNIFVSLWMPQRNYAQNGCALSFLLTCSYYVVDVPDGYSTEEVDRLTENYTSDEAAALTLDQAPNIIVIMNESFADLQVDTDIETTEDYMPFIHSLSENTIKGNLYVSVLGGNTANTEMEFQTGNSLAFFPARSVPYNSYLRHLTGSFTWNLRNSGYGSVHAVHPYYSNGWSREIVYPLLGFTDFISRDQFVNPGLVRSFISDEESFNKLIEEYETLRETSDAPFYDFNVTMQNHGGYAGTHGLIEETIGVIKPANANDQLIQYLNLVKESDNAFQMLTEYFDKVKEPTIIVMFGDHQPGFTDSVYDSLMGQKTSTLNIADTSRMYITPFVIWANYELPGAGTTDMNMSANYLSSYIQNLAGTPLTGYNKYLLDLMKKVPVISAVCYMGDDGVIHAPDEESQYSDLIHQYQILQYNNMFDQDNRKNEFFFLKNADLTEQKFEHTSALPK